MLFWKKIKIGLLSLYVNDQCNLNCLYCYNKENSNLKKKLLTFEEQKKVINEAKGLGANCILIPGKEPLLYKNIPKLISYIRSLKLNVILFTNGTNLNRKNIKLLYNNGVQLHFKLDSLDKNIYETIVNKSGVHKWVDYKYCEGQNMVTKEIPLTLKLLIDQGFNNTQEFPCLIIECCVNKINYKTIPELSKFCKLNNLGIRIERLIEHGNALNNYKKLYLTENQNKRLFSKLKKILGDTFIKSHKSGTCILRYAPVIFEDGGIGFCLVEKPPGDYGNIKRNSLKKMFKKINKITCKKPEVTYDNFRVCPGRSSCANNFLTKK